MADKVTSSQVAARAGVSRSAVSRVFTPGASASAETAARVRKAAEELGYRPNALARALLTGESRLIGLVVSYLDNHLYPVLLQKLSHALQARGYHLLMFMAGSEEGGVESVVDDILDYQVAGLVLASVSLSSDWAARCEALGLPVILLNRRMGQAGENAVVSDNEAGGYLATRHLIERGAHRIAHLAGQAGASTQREREAGMMRALTEAGLSLHARAEGNFDAEGAREATRALMQSASGAPDALFVANDYMALIALDTLRYELRVRVPTDIAIAGFDDVPAAAWPAYGLTTIRQNVEAMVDLTVSALLDNAGPPRALPVELIERATT
ncbi:MAG: LacI family DNA-binding transcriptional regulator [Pseudomonadota bacterium]